MRRTKGRAERMRAVVDCLPSETKVAMLEGLDRYEIIAGAYSTRGGGVCPMLAAHRCGGRTDFRSFARAWDRFTGAGRARRASERELRTLRAQLERSVWEEDERRRALLGKPSGLERPAPAPEPRPRRRRKLGAWLLPFRDWDGYRDGVQKALREVDEAPPPALEIADAELERRDTSPLVG
jgi:hypothetical protein